MTDALLLVQWPGWPIFLCLGFLSSLLFLFLLLKRNTNPERPLTDDTKDAVELGCYPPVEPLPDFDWRTKEPVKIRPFRPKYHLTMSMLDFNNDTWAAMLIHAGIQDADVSELIEMDKNYIERITLRKKIMAEYPETVLAAEKCIKPAVDEFYVWLVGTYLPTRFPRMFLLRSSTGEESARLQNLVTNEEYSLSPEERPLDTLRVMGGLVEDDLLFLLPSDDGDGYMLKGFVTCFPNGFNTAKKLNLKLRDIHKPVPQYKEKLEKSMDRFFDRLKVGKFVKRANVSEAIPCHLLCG